MIKWNILQNTIIQEETKNTKFPIFTDIRENETAGEAKWAVIEHENLDSIMKLKISEDRYSEWHIKTQNKLRTVNETQPPINIRNSRKEQIVLTRLRSGHWLIFHNLHTGKNCLSLYAECNFADSWPYQLSKTL